MLDGGCDLVEVGMPYSDPVMDGPTIQAAAETALRGGIRLRDVLAVVGQIAEAGGRAVVMTYYNPMLRYGVDAFARDLAAAGGLGVITPDLIPDEAERLAGRVRRSTAWTGSSWWPRRPPTSGSPLPRRPAAGFLYAASTMGVTGARDTVGSAAARPGRAVPARTPRCRSASASGCAPARRPPRSPASPTP